jgi:hypothetical protein
MSLEETVETKKETGLFKLSSETSRSSRDLQRRGDADDVHLLLAAFVQVRLHE